MHVRVKYPTTPLKHPEREDIIQIQVHIHSYIE